MFWYVVGNIVYVCCYGDRIKILELEFLGLFLGFIIYNIVILSK